MVGIFIYVSGRFENFLRHPARSSRCSTTRHHQPLGVFAIFGRELSAHHGRNAILTIAGLLDQRHHRRL